MDNGEKVTLSGMTVNEASEGTMIEGLLQK